MKSPIPEPGALDPSSQVGKPAIARGPRPPVLTVLAILELLTVVIQSIIYKPNPAFAAMGAGNFERTTNIVIAVIWLALVYLLWRGANWARIAVLIGGVLGVLGIFSIAGQDTPNQILAIFNTLLAGAWIYFLLSRPVVAFTKGITAP